MGKSPGGFQGRPIDVLDLLWYRPKERGFFKPYVKNQLTSLKKKMIVLDANLHIN